MASRSEAAVKGRPNLVNWLTGSGARWWLTFRYRLLSRRYGQLVIEEIDGVPLIVLPQVFNPVLLRTGAFMVQTLVEHHLPAGNRVLDLGTGSGAGAVFAARLGGRVTAVDINPEAVRCARLNAMLNRVEEQIEVLPGDLFEPVAGRQFDLILFNPPFYRGRPQDNLDHAWRGQDVFERFAGDLRQFLAPGGRCWLLLSSDGDGDQLLSLLDASSYDVQLLTRRDLLNEVLTIYEIRTQC
jgi:HemK-related putative methylase